MYSQDWSTTSVGSLPTGWAGDSSFLNVQATPVDGSSPRSLQSSPDGSATHKAYYGSGDGIGGDGTFLFHTKAQGVAVFLFRLSNASGTAYTAYAAQLWGDPTSGGLVLDRFIAGSNSAAGGGNVASVGNGGSSTAITFTDTYAVTVVAKGNSFTVQVQRASDSKYFTPSATWSASAQNAITATDGSTSAISGAGQFGFLEYSASGQTNNFGSLSITPLTVSASLGTTPLTAGGGTSTATAIGFTGPVNWTSSNPAVSSINSSTGVYTPVGAGTCTFTATGVSNATQTATTGTLTVNAPTGPSVTPTSATINQLATVQLVPAGFTASAVTYASGTPGTATVNSSGLVTGVAHGQSTPQTSTITIRGVSDTTQVLTVVVTVAAVAITVSPTTANVSLGGTQPFTAVVTGTTNTAVNWTQTGGVSVSSSGLFTASGSAGSATVTPISVADPTKSATANITVAATLTIYDVTNLGGGYTGLVGTVGLKWLDSSGTVVQARSTANIVEIAPGSYRGLYAGAAAGLTYFSVWDTGGSSPVYDSGTVTAPASGSGSGSAGITLGSLQSELDVRGLTSATSAKLDVAVSTRSTLTGPAGFSALQISAGKVAIDLTQPIPLRDQTPVTAPTIGDGLAAAHAAAVGGESKPNTPGITTGTLKHADGSTARTFTYDSGSVPALRS